MDQITVDDALWLDRLETVFGAMDTAYDTVAEQYGFICNGCEDNCCLTRFYHHTLIEYLYLKRGLSCISPSVLASIEERARMVVSTTADADSRGEVPRIMCPLNNDGMCLTYRHRPMVCRLHGLAHELKKPGQDPVRGSGCDLFSEQTEAMPYIPFDRTPFYIDMAHLERDVRMATGIGIRFRHTIAEMILL